MWQSNQNASAQISPILLANFNPHHILEPQRNSDVPQVEKLIDIDDLSLDANINASLLDLKKDFEPIDLYQNMYVTPTLIKRNISFNSSNESASTSSDIDYTGFFDKLESGGSVYKADDDKFKNHDVKLIDTVKITKEPKDFVSKVAQEDLDPEDLFAELLRAKAMEKSKSDEVDQILSNNSDSTQSQFPKLKVLKPPPHIEATILKDNVNKNNKTNTASSKTSKQDDAKFDSAEQLIRLKLNSDLFNDINEPPKLTSTRQSNIKINDEELNILNFEVIAMKKDAKAYRNKRVLKPESVTCNYTIGADYYEKSVVLPQIMARIKARQRQLEEKGSLKKRLMLDTGSKPVNCASVNHNNIKNGAENTASSSKSVPSKAQSNVPNKFNGINTSNTFGKLNPVVLMADCNKEREKAWLQRRMFQNFITNGK